MTKFSNAENEDFKKLSRTLEIMLQKSGPKVEANWTTEARTKQQGNQFCDLVASFYYGGEIRLESFTISGFRHKMSIYT